MRRGQKESDRKICIYHAIYTLNMKVSLASRYFWMLGRVRGGCQEARPERHRRETHRTCGIWRHQEMLSVVGHSPFQGIGLRPLVRGCEGARGGGGVAQLALA